MKMNPTSNNSQQEGHEASTLCASPFLRWPGGKRWLLSRIRTVIKDYEFRHYYEPFLGGGALFFGLAPSAAFLSDINRDLINTYIQVRDHVEHIVDSLKKIAVDLKSYNEIRSMQPTCNIERAVRFLYLNRTAFSGIYRVNKRGDFNVPYGGGSRTPASLWRDDLLVNSSRLLQGASIFTADFESALDLAADGDLVYCDPIYTVSHNNNGFRRYNERSFSWPDQERLAGACRRCMVRGATVVVSNARHGEVRNLYKGFIRHVVKRQSRLCPRPEMRRMTEEYLFIGRP